MNTEQERNFAKSRLGAVGFRHQFLGETYDHVFFASTISEEADGSGVNITKYIYDYKNETAVPFTRFYPKKLFFFHKYTPFSWLYTSQKRKVLTFVSPSVWKDPYEGELVSKYDKQVACLCMTCERVINEESSWNAYEGSNAQDPVIRISYNVPAFLSRLNRIGKNTGIDFYITTVDYSLSQDGIKSLKHLVAESKGNDDYTERLIHYLSFKRKAFEYENEVRFIAVKSNGNNVLDKGHKIDFEDFEWSDDLISCITLPPLQPFHDERKKYSWELQVIRNYGLNKYLSVVFPHTKIEQCHLYDSTRTSPNVIKKRLKLED